MNKIEQLLRQMGDTAEKVAQYLHTNGISGIPNHPGYCPVSKYLRANGVESATTGIRDAGGKVGEHWCSADLPSAVKDFVNRFDLGGFPQVKEIRGQTRL
jgi:hypothetical protein